MRGITHFYEQLFHFLYFDMIRFDSKMNKMLSTFAGAHFFLLRLNAIIGTLQSDKTILSHAEVC
jgi:hypothetical protein